MIERQGDIWKSGADCICVTTNGMIKRNGELVMGKGIALQAAMKYPKLAGILAYHVKRNGNIPTIVDFTDVKIASFPTKDNWRNDSTLFLICRSATLLASMVPEGVERVALTRPGCGNGNLNWEDVKPVLDNILDDRFVVYHN